MINRHRPPLGILPVAVAVVQLIGTHFAARRFDESLPWGAVLLLLTGPALLLLRRRAPGPMVAGIGLVTVGYVAAGFPWGPFPLSFAIGLVLAVLAGARWWAWGSAAAAGIVFLLLALQHGESTRVFFVLVWLIVVLLAGELGRSAKARRDEFRRAANERARHQRDEERLVLARDIHDVVAHSLSMINVQASVALHLAKKDGDTSGMLAALENIKTGSKDALSEVRDVLAVLRQDAPRVPSQRLEQLDELIARVRGANLSITFTPPVLPPPEWIDERVENILYRVVQESLTNIVRHAKASRVTVAVELDDAHAAVAVTDDGIGMGTGDEGNGIGGMRERLGAHGGTLTITTGEAGGADRAGTRINAWLPAPGKPHA
ncbi:sensor histidine kinase [Paeniglutamicibacter sp. ORCA_105]|jgi:signal transduction histidine kinase|uniref:sensor histidine kinase n=1 Tax=Paeniglutamicibacter sp. ORCA_105 TaxID=3377336 RepID=UPI0038949BA4